MKIAKQCIGITGVLAVARKEATVVKVVVKPCWRP